MIDNPLLLLKFSNNIEWLEDLQKGIMFMNNAKYFIDREELDGVQGIGDKYELSNIFKSGIGKMMNPTTNEVIAEFSINEASFRLDALTKMPMYCMALISESNFLEAEANENNISHRLNLTDYEIEKYKLEFGENVLIINFRKFINQMESVFKEMNLKVFRSRVMYHTYDNLEERLEAHKNQDPKMFFFKHDSFAHQSEYRVVIWNIQSDVPYIVNIGDISEFSDICKVDDLRTNLVFKSE